MKSPQIHKINEMEELRNKSTTITRTRSINDLPDDILIHILSFLPTTLDAIKTTLISPTWRTLWRSVPNLSFIQHLFPSSNSPVNTLASFARFFTEALVLRNPEAPLLKFRLVLYVDQHFTKIVDGCIHLAILSGITHLELDLPRDHYWNDHNGDTDDHNFDPWKDLWYCFDFGVLNRRNVRVLKLNACKISLPADILGNNVGLSSSLRSLSLDRVNLTSEMVSEIITGCANLEDLVLSRCEDLEDLKIYSSKLRKLSLKHVMNVGSVEIFAPNLYSLVLVFFKASNYVFSDISSLVEARVICLCYCYWSSIVRLLGHVQRLTVQNCWFQLLLLENGLPERFILSNLNYLELRTSYSKSELLGMAALLERCPNLVTMILAEITDHYEEEVLSEEYANKPINLSIPCLRRVELRCYTKTENELLLVDLLEEQGVEDILLYHTEVGEPSSIPKRKRSNGELDYFDDDI